MDESHAQFETGFVRLASRSGPIPVDLRAASVTDFCSGKPMHFCSDVYISGRPLFRNAKAAIQERISSGSSAATPGAPICRMISACRVGATEL
jgi:hypothetical protein